MINKNTNMKKVTFAVIVILFITACKSKTPDVQVVIPSGKDSSQILPPLIDTNPYYRVDTPPFPTNPP